MSNIQTIGGGGGGGGGAGIVTVTGNTGGAVPGQGAPINLNLVGDATQGTAVNGTIATSTQVVTVGNATAAATAGAAQKGVSSYNSEDFTVVSGYVSQNFKLVGTGTTVGATTADLITFPLGATPGTYIFDANFSSFDVTTPGGAGAGYSIFGSTRTTGATAFLVGTPDKINNEDTAVAAGTADLVVSANNAILRVTGVVGLTIHWKVVATYVGVN